MSLVIVMMRPAGDHLVLSRHRRRRMVGSTSGSSMKRKRTLLTGGGQLRRQVQATGGRGGALHRGAPNGGELRIRCRLAQQPGSGPPGVAWCKGRRGMPEGGCGRPLSGGGDVSACLALTSLSSFKGLGNLTDAMADCGRARALDPSFVRAHTRMAALLQVGSGPAPPRRPSRPRAPPSHPSHPSHSLLQDTRRHEGAERVLSELSRATPSPSAQPLEPLHPAAARMTSQERSSVQVGRWRWGHGPRLLTSHTHTPPCPLRPKTPPRESPSLPPPQVQLQEVRSTLKWQKQPDHYKVLALDRSCR